MSGLIEKPLPSWRDAAAATGFGVLCIRSEKGEWFTVSAVDLTKVAILANAGLRPGTMVSEAEMLERLAHAAMSTADAHAWIALSREWATTFTHSKTRHPN